MSNDKKLVTAKNQELSVVESSLKQTITLHAQYVDKLGNSSKGAKGLAMQINIRIAKAFGEKRGEFDMSVMVLLVSLLNRIKQVIETGEQEFKPRPHIKKDIYKTIEDYGQLVGTFK
jgi:hypothetical protein